MTTEDKDLDQIKVSEDKDGGAVVELPESMSAAEDGDNDDNSHDEKHADGGDVGDDGDDADQPNDTEAIRAARRARRKAKKEYIKQTNAEKDVRLQNLLRQNQELTERLSVVERKTNSADLARMDKVIEDKELRLQYAKMKMAEATSASDGDAFAKAQDMWYETRREVENLRAMKEAAVKNTSQPSPTNDTRELQRQANKWMERNSWFDPQGEDEDSEIAQVIDKKLAKEGWNPNQPEYWDELDRRLQKRLPHRYTGDTDERPTRARPRSVVTSSGRENFSGNGSKNSFVLKPEQVRAMKDAGFWDDPQKRAKMIKRYAIEARNNSYQG